MPEPHGYLVAREPDPLDIALLKLAASKADRAFIPISAMTPALRDRFNRVRLEPTCLVNNGAFTIAIVEVDEADFIGFEALLTANPAG